MAGIRRWRGLITFVAILLLCGVVTAAFGGPRPAEAPPPVTIEAETPTRALLRESTRLVVRVTNEGASPIQDIGIKLNRAYANVMTVTSTQPPARIDDASTEKRLYFGPLRPGETGEYRVTMSPQRTGDVQLTLRVVSVQRAFEPTLLPDRRTGATEIKAQTIVIERP